MSRRNPRGRRVVRRRIGPAMIWGTVLVALLIVSVTWMITASISSQAFDAINGSVRQGMTGEGATTFDVLESARALTVDGGAVAISIAIIVWGLRKMAQRERVTEVIY